MVAHVKGRAESTIGNIKALYPPTDMYTLEVCKSKKEFGNITKQAGVPNLYSTKDFEFLFFLPYFRTNSVITITRLKRTLG